MELNQVEAFVAIVDTKNFSRAAARLYVSQPAISRRIDLLEKEVGSPLFERTPNGVILTEAGSIFLPFARQALAAAKDGLEAVRTFTENVQGTVKLALVGTLASTTLTKKLQQFKIDYPQIRLMLHTGRSNEVSRLVQNGEVHLGLRYFTGSAKQLETQIIGEEALVIAGSAHQFSDNPSPHPKALTTIPWVTFPLDQRSSGEPYARLIRRQLTKAGLDDLEMITIDSLTVQKRLIEAGFGVGFLPISSLQEELRLGSIRILNIPALTTTIPITLLRRKKGYLPPGAKALLAQLTTSD